MPMWWVLALCGRVSRLLPRDGAERAYEQPGREADSCPTRLSDPPPTGHRKVCGGEEFPTRLKLPLPNFLSGPGGGGQMGALCQ